MSVCNKIIKASGIFCVTYIQLSQHAFFFHHFISFFVSQFSVTSFYLIQTIFHFLRGLHQSLQCLQFSGKKHVCSLLSEKLDHFCSTEKLLIVLIGSNEVSALTKTNVGPFFDRCLARRSFIILKKWLKKQKVRDHCSKVLHRFSLVALQMDL